jgi:hypothetical protein
VFRNLEVNGEAAINIRSIDPAVEDLAHANLAVGRLSGR